MDEKTQQTNNFTFKCKFLNNGFQVKSRSFPEEHGTLCIYLRITGRIYTGRIYTPCGRNSGKWLSPLIQNQWFLDKSCGKFRMSKLNAKYG